VGMTGTVEFIQKIRYVEVPDENGEPQIYAIPETVENVQELVRCGECKYSIAAVFGSGRYCGLHRKTRADDWFCADGERREGDA